MRGWLRLQAAADYASIHRNTLRKWVEDGLTCYQVDGVKLIKAEDIDNYIEQHAKVEFDVVKALKL